MALDVGLPRLHVPFRVFAINIYKIGLPFTPDQRRHRFVNSIFY